MVGTSSGATSRPVGIRDSFLMTDEQLLQMANDIRERAYAPYSGFKVGAALLCADGTVFTGVNIESETYTPSICAERTAFFKAISEGYSDFVKIAVTCDKPFCSPCGVCRQVMVEHAPDLEILLGNPQGTFKRMSIKELLPESFSLND
ncbi:MAG: cytidine deaminase [Candidatus Atribacteria bacterium]|jgi:cytidine deaminase|nr:MAG: cytidine deaminase [Candidatus Atribacteria bacterium]